MSPLLSPSHFTINRIQSMLITSIQISNLFGCYFTIFTVFSFPYLPYYIFIGKICWLFLLFVTELYWTNLLLVDWKIFFIFFFSCPLHTAQCTGVDIIENSFDNPFWPFFQNSYNKIHVDLLDFDKLWHNFTKIIIFRITNYFFPQQKSIQAI